jgi:hypothetical protein
MKVALILQSRDRPSSPTSNRIYFKRSIVKAAISSCHCIRERRKLRDAINNHCIQEAALRTGATIRYCRANITNRKRMSLSTAYGITYGAEAIASGILPLIPGCPLMITKNINPLLGISSS